MTSKERVRRALQKKPVDRVPIFMWYHPQTRRRLGRLLEIRPEYVPSVMGDVDTQGVLPHGTADQVRRATAELLDGMTADGGGYILAASHTVPPETPDENIFAMYDEAGIPREEIFDKAAQVRKSWCR